jgi:hypothetical protein
MQKQVLGWQWTRDDSNEVEVWKTTRTLLAPLPDQICDETIRITAHYQPSCGHVLVTVMADKLPIEGESIGSIMGENSIEAATVYAALSHDSLLQMSLTSDSLVSRIKSGEISEQQVGEIMERLLPGPAAGWSGEPFPFYTTLHTGVMICGEATYSDGSLKLELWPRHDRTDLFEQRFSVKDLEQAREQLQRTRMVYQLEAYRKLTNARRYQA